MSGYWKVRSEVHAFDTKEQAEAFRDAFIDAFCAMPESEGYGSSHVIVFCDSDDMDDDTRPQEARDDE